MGITDKKCVNHNEIEDNPKLMYFLFLNCSINPNKIPVNRMIKIIILFVMLSRYTWSDDKSHVIQDPEVIANILNTIMGIKDSSVWWLDIHGCDLIIDLFEKSVIRIEYEAVIPMDKIIKIDIMKFRFEVNINSIITSFEKNPDMNGIPIKAILLIPKIEIVNG